jgi:hypothetical protein
MTYIIAFAILAGALVGGCLLLGLRGRVAVAAVALAVQAFIIAAALGLPLPWWAEHGCMSRVEAPRVLGAWPDERAGQILVWLQAPECVARVYSLPYSHSLAEQLAEAQGDAAERGTGVRARRLFEPTLDTLEPKFYAEPVQALPPKPEPPKPLEFQS